MNFDFASPLEAARYLVSEGFPVLPIKPGAKAPPVAWKEYQDRLPTDAELVAWFGGDTGWQVGLVQGTLAGTVVFDADDLAAMAWAESNLPRTPLRVRTGSGRGMHYYYRQPPGLAVTNARSAWVLPPRSELAADIRGQGGQVLAPGALHKSGRRYELDQGCLPLCRATVEALPFWPAEQLAPPKPAPRPLREPKPGEGGPGAYQRARLWLETREPAVEGQGGDTHTFATACALVRGFELSDSEALELLENWNTRCLPPWSSRELAAKVAGARRYGREPFGYLLNAAPVRLEERGSGRIEAKPAREDQPKPPERRWPTLAQEAYHGLVGDLVRALAPVTEADPTGLLLQALITFGHQVGRGPHFRVEDTEHHANLFGVLVGASAVARKGTGLDRVRQVAHRAVTDGPGALQTVSGAGSGEGVIARVADRPGRTQEADAEAKRVLFEESEFAGVLRVAARENNLLSPVLRNAWDGRKLANLVKNDPIASTGHHIALLGHVTSDELTRLLSEGDCANGFGNRFIWWLVKRSQYLPEGADLPLHLVEELSSRWRLAVRSARELGSYRVHRNPQAKAVWSHVYRSLSEPPPGLAGQLMARGAPIVVRLSLVYALLDRSRVVTEEHLLAALACWDYAAESVRYLFGERLADPDADTLLAELKASPEGLTRTEIVHQVFSRNKRRSEIDRALQALQEMGLARAVLVRTGGRPAERWFYGSVVNVVCRNGFGAPSPCTRDNYVVYVVKGKEGLAAGTPHDIRQNTTEPPAPEPPALRLCPVGCGRHVRGGGLCGPCQEREQREGVSLYAEVDIL